MRLNRRRFMEGAAAFGMIAGTGRAEETKASTLPDWREGFLDIHHICTGRGSSSFIVCPDERTIFATGLHAKARARLGAAASAIRPQGHVVIRVEPGGERFRVFVLDPERFAVLDATDDLRSQANA